MTTTTMVNNESTTIGSWTRTQDDDEGHDDNITVKGSRDGCSRCRAPPGMFFFPTSPVILIDYLLQTTMNTNLNLHIAHQHPDDEWGRVLSLFVRIQYHLDTSDSSTPHSTTPPLFALVTTTTMMVMAPIFFFQGIDVSYYDAIRIKYI